MIADPNARIAQINPEHYSHFIEHLGDCIYDGIWVGPSPPVDHTDGIRQFTLDALRGVGPAVMVRLPRGDTEPADASLISTTGETASEIPNPDRQRKTSSGAG